MRAYKLVQDKAEIYEMIYENKNGQWEKTKWAQYKLQGRLKKSESESRWDSGLSLGMQYKMNVNLKVSQKCTLSL